MDQRLLATIIIFPIWLVLILVFRRHRQWLLYYLVAAFGLTLMIVFIAEYMGWDQKMVDLASYQVYLISKFLMNMPVNLLSQGRFQLMTPEGSDILKLGIECSAILEMSIAVSLIIFYPLFNIKQKILRASFGLVVTYIVNILRLMIIILFAQKFGSDYIFVAHAGIARVFFFICELILYWYLLTKPTVKSVGDSIEKKIPLGQTAVVGGSFAFYNAAFQAIVVILFTILTLASFRVSTDWKVAFSETVAQPGTNERPLIYKEETTMEPSGSDKEVMGENYESIGQMQFQDLSSGGMEDKIFYAKTISNLNLYLKETQQSLSVELYLNHKFYNRTYINGSPDNPITDFKVFEANTYIYPGNSVEVRVKNLGQSTETFTLDLASVKEASE